MQEQRSAKETKRKRRAKPLGRPRCATASSQFMQHRGQPTERHLGPQQQSRFSTSPLSKRLLVHSTFLFPSHHRLIHRARQHQSRHSRASVDESQGVAGSLLSCALLVAQAFVGNSPPLRSYPELRWLGRCWISHSQPRGTQCIAVIPTSNGLKRLRAREIRVVRGQLVLYTAVAGCRHSTTDAGLSGLVDSC
jgi:hypothetical protein